MALPAALVAVLLAIPIGTILRMVLGSLSVVLFPKLFKYIYMNYKDEVMSYAFEMLQDMGLDMSDIVIEMTGIAGYLAQKFQLVDCLFTVMTTSITIFILGFFRE